MKKQAKSAQFRSFFAPSRLHDPGPPAATFWPENGYTGKEPKERKGHPGGGLALARREALMPEALTTNEEASTSVRDTLVAGSGRPTA